MRGVEDRRQSNSSNSCRPVHATMRDPSTVHLSREELAGVLGVKPNTLSSAAHGRYRCQGYHVSKWAVFHPRGNQVLRYEVPLSVIEEEAPESQHVGGDKPV
jgi:hypothetical protein